ncbi:unnamed protein product (macronuclear) [Paramecium tetraurelia]|uniref:Uncharacterized protein n=1 Tax=Paramecium tetraurelia TaxID=5888 RepID=A0DDI1_PARTE|nr:uncharacterized protein GSPATT00015958001 [Paramecium tetraurelia]CAK81098.1 unnamed protein product [Paramecium tetraurelia]|eukprot:XP_001448495.1 hypothetical protein (macronuclear) [Paramecium tetraurelia strain d4-2]
MNYQILFYTQIIQNIWWIICSWIFYQPYEYQLCILSVSSIVIRITIIILERRITHIFILAILYLLHNCLYMEASIRMPMNNPFTNHSNSLMILINYQHANKESKENIQIISKFGFPIFCLLRTMSITFIQANYSILESCILIFIFLSLIAKDELKKKNEAFQNSMKDLGSQDQHNFNQKFITFFQQDSKKQSLGTSFKKSRTHYSQYQEKPDIFQNIPLYNEPRTMDENIKTSLQFQNLKKSFNKKISNISADKSDQQLHTFFQNIINNIFSAGVVILNQNQKVTFMNNKCEKLLGQKGSDKVVECLKKIIIANSLHENDESPLGQIPPRSQAKMNKATFERIVKYHNENLMELDIFDAFLFPQKYLHQFYQNLSPHSEFDQRSSLSESVNETFLQRKDAVTYEHIMSEGGILKKLRIVILPTYMTNAQQEQLSYPSYQKVHISKTAIQAESVQPIIVVKIKNITKKHKIEQMNKEKEIHNSLLKSFSHELKTPLNSGQDMLVILKDRIKDPKLQEFVEIAHISIIFLIHQINDILDYAAMQSNTFKYRYVEFKSREIVDEIKYIYSSQLHSKKIDLQVKFDEKKVGNIRQDKQRIMQVLINLLNNSCKFTPEGGKIVFSLKIIDYPFIKLQVKDSGIGIGSEQLQNLRKVLTSSMGKSLHRSRIKKSLGLGLNISARIVEGLVQKNDGTLEIISKNKNKGTKIFFIIENLLIFRDESVRNPMISEYTTKNNTYKQQMSQYEGSNCSQVLPLLRQLSENSKFEAQSPSKKSKTIKSKFFNLLPANQESSLDMADNYSYRIDIPISPEYFQYKEENDLKKILKPSQCQQCTRVLIVDDIPFNQIALKALLLHYNIKVEQAYDGYQAIDLVKKQLDKHCQYFTLIFMDIEMPGINGFQATKDILQITQDQTQIIMCSAYDTEENFREGEAVGMSEFLPKPVNKQELERILDRFGFL